MHRSRTLCRARVKHLNERGGRILSHDRGIIVRDRNGDEIRGRVGNGIEWTKLVDYQPVAVRIVD